MNVEQILRDLIALRTDDKTIGNKACADYICQKLSAQKIIFERMVLSGSSVENIIAGINIAELKNINDGLILSAHMDTVGANINLWNTDPFTACLRDNCIYGRGTVDMKYFIATVLSLLPELKNVDYPVFLVFSGDEETDVQGVRQLISFMKDRNIHPQYALVGEPTNFNLCLAHNGYCGFRTYVKGVSGHSSRPDLGVNAIYAAAKIVAKIEELNAYYQPLGTTLNVGVIQGGTGRNSIAGNCRFDWDVRYVSDNHRHSIVDEIEKFCKELQAENLSLAVSYEVMEELPAFENENNNRILSVANMLLQTDKNTLPFATEAGFFQRYAVQTLVCGAGDTALAHAANEYIRIGDLNKYRDFLARFIKAI